MKNKITQAEGEVLEDILTHYKQAKKNIVERDKRLAQYITDMVSDVARGVRKK